MAIESNLERLLRLEAEADLPRKWNADTFIVRDGYTCGDYMAAALNANPHLLRIASAAKKLDKTCSGGFVPSPYEVTKLLQAVAAFEAAKIGGGE